MPKSPQDAVTSVAKVVQGSSFRVIALPTRTSFCILSIELPEADKEGEVAQTKNILKNCAFISDTVHFW